MNRRAFTLLEVLVGLLLACLTVGLATAVVARQRLAQDALGRRAERLATARLARHLLGREVRASAVPTTAGPTDSLPLRAFRGTAVVCPTPPDAPGLWVEVEGIREAEPSKDSVEVVTALGGRVIHGLQGRETSPHRCRPGGATLERWTLSGEPPPEAVWARYFESGAYHIAERALRYRRGAAGRQPLTPEVLAVPGGGFTAEGSSLRVRLRWSGDPVPREAWTITLRGGPGGR